MRAWVNGREDLTDGSGGGPLALGAFLLSQASPDAGAYAVLSSEAAASPGVVAEDPAVMVQRITAQIYAGTQESADIAARAYALAVGSLSGAPVAMGAMTCLASANVDGPAYVEPAPDGGEQYSFTVSADFILYE